KPRSASVISCFVPASGAPSCGFSFFLQAAIASARAIAKATRLRPIVSARRGLRVREEAEDQLHAAGEVVAAASSEKLGRLKQNEEEQLRERIGELLRRGVKPVEGADEPVFVERAVE